MRPLNLGCLGNWAAELGGSSKLDTQSFGAQESKTAEVPAFENLEAFTLSAWVILACQKNQKHTTAGIR
jgi:hypothetical protein